MKYQQQKTLFVLKVFGNKLQALTKIIVTYKRKDVQNSNLQHHVCNEQKKAKSIKKKIIVNNYFDVT